MSELQFPKNPTVGQEYDFAPYRYYWDGTKWKTKGIGYNPVNDLRDELEPRVSNNESKVFEALRRSYADAGLNLVEGSFEEGGELLVASDVMITASGDGYSWGGPEFPHNVAPGTDPTAAGSGYVPRTDVVLRGELAGIDGANLVGGATYAQIRAYSGSATKIHCLGRANIFDGASGDFYLDATDTTSADVDGYILIDASGGRWKRQDNGEPVNPVFCGADPSGVAVSTLALQTAHNYANSLLKINQEAVGDLNRFAIKEVHYPHGVYKVDGKINVSGFSDITGAEARIESTNSADDIFSCGQINPTTGAYIDGAAYAVSIKGITFFGGRRHLVIANNNLDANQLNIEECSFFNSASFSSDVVATSGQLAYKMCKWSANHRIARLQNDMKEFSDCWFDCAKPTTANADQIVNSAGTLYFYRCLGLPGDQSAAAWVADYQNHVQMYNCRFGDEGGNGGWPLVRAFGCPDTSTRYSPAIVIRDCYTGGGLNAGRTDAALVYIDSPAADGIKRVPPIIIIDNVTKASSVVAIGTSLTEAEFNTASNLHVGLRYYSVDGVQTESYGLSSFLPTPIKQRALRRTDVDLKSPISGDATIFKHFISPQALTNLNSVFRVNYYGEVANNANTKALRVKLDGVTLPTATYTPAINASKKFNGEITVQALNEYSVLVSHKVVDTSGVAVVSIEYLGIRNFVNNEYALEVSTQGGAVGDVTIVMLASEIKL